MISSASTNSSSNFGDSFVPEGDLHWFCLRAKCKREAFAAKQLASRTGLEVFAPRLAVTGRRGAIPNSTEALFPGYLFCRLDLGRDLRFVESSPDVLGLVRFGRYSPPVSDEIVSFLRAQTTSPFAAEPLLRVGDWVSVLTGAFMGQRGRVFAFDQGGERASLLVSLLGAEVPLKLPVSFLRGEVARSQFPASLLADATPR